MAVVLVSLFYAVTLGAIAFFVHKVLWFVRYRNVQGKLVARALEKLTEEADTTVVRWDQGAEMSWSVASQADANPTDYVRRVEDQLAFLEAQLRSAHQPLAERFAAAVTQSSEPELVTILRMPRPRKSSIPVSVLLGFAPIPSPRFPDPVTFDLQVKSRYGFFRRLLAFLFGAADVVYSSQHVVRMSQDPHVPRSLLLRRISLVFLILGALAVDIGFGIRGRLIDWSSEWIPREPLLRPLARYEWAPNLLGLGLWLGAYGAVYVALYIMLRVQSHQHVRQLEKLKRNHKSDILAIRDRHIRALRRWTVDYASTMDSAAELSLSQARLLIERTRHRLRRRVASGQLLAVAAEVATCFFDKLPESATNLHDVATERSHSLKHLLWPRAEEMVYQVEIAQFRHAWRDIEIALNALRGEHPDPDIAAQLWRSLVRYARMFPQIVPADLFKRLQEAHGETVGRVVKETDTDIEYLESRLIEIADALRHTVESLPILVETRIELATQSMNAAVARYIGDALLIRERARLEAMAFEI